MWNYSLIHFTEILRTEGEMMFRNAKYDKENKWVYDADNGMISTHDFHDRDSLEAQLPKFYEKIQRRTRNTINQLSQSRRVGIIMNRKVKKQELTDFADTMCRMFPECYFYIVNIKDIPGQPSVKTEFIIQTSEYTITELSIDDAHKNGRDKNTNPAFWLGNSQLWEHLMIKHFRVKGSRFKRIKRKLEHFLQMINRKIKSLYRQTEQI